jgi:hypothetical protein
MSSSSLSYLKSSLLATLLGAGALASTRIGARYLGIAKALVHGVGWVAALASASIVLGGIVVLYRNHGTTRGWPDLFLGANTKRDLSAVSSGTVGWGIRLRRLLRRAFGGTYLLVGDVVEVRSLREIEATLDDSNSLDGLPFMEEMRPFCGRQFRVFRCVDKIFDYGRSGRLRSIGDVVLLAGLRCNGGAHGGCQASCYLLWKTAWLTRVQDEYPARAPATHGRAEVSARVAPRDPQSTYTCQFTQLTSASRPASRWDVRQELKPLLSGNLTVAAFCVGVFTRLFNKFDRLRGGTGYPRLSGAAVTKTPLLTYGLAAGDYVRVLGSESIAATLDVTSRNRGLWFDLEMLKHCLRRYRVSGRIEQIIDISTGRMMQMKTPCIVLEGVDNSGELLRFWPQHELLYWREAWLQPEAKRPGS